MTADNRQTHWVITIHSSACKLFSHSSSAFVVREWIKDLEVVRFATDIVAPVLLAFVVPLVCFECVVVRVQRLQIGEVVCECPVSGDVAAVELRDGSDVVEREVVETYLFRRP